MDSLVNHISISIQSPKENVYKFASNPENFPLWLAFLQSVTKKTDTIWTAETNSGKIEIAICPENIFGVIDHTVTLPDGTTVNNTLRVIENGTHSEVVFTLFKAAGKSEKEFRDDSRLVKADLESLKELLEREQRNS